MLTLFLVLGLSCTASLVLVPAVRALARRYGLVDHPDGRRKTQVRAVPLAGGLAVLLALAGTVTALCLVPNRLQPHLLDQLPELVGLAVAAVVICVVGVADDCGYLRGRHKFAGQLLAIAVVMRFGLVVHSVRFFDWHIELGLLAVPFTAFWLLGAINSLNLLDGMDGLLSSVGIIISLGMAATAVLTEKWGAACLCVALAGSLLGFLRSNFPPASIFLGDAGSMLIGLVVGVLAIRSSLKGPATIALAAPAAMLAIPAFDTLAAILRRKLTGRSIYDTDRSHLHHCLLRRGLSNRLALLAISSCCLLTVLGALATLAFNNEAYAILASLVVVAGLVASRLLGYPEFLLLKNRLARVLHSFLPARRNSSPHHSAVHVQGSADWGELMERLVGAATVIGLERIRLDVNAPALHESYHEVWDCGLEDLLERGLWRTELPLFLRGQVVGRLEVTGRRNGGPLHEMVAAVEEMVDHFERQFATPGVADHGPQAREDLAAPLHPPRVPDPHPALRLSDSPLVPEP
jgi:UDP-GlcNAc:undecaprenyl-phosphate GlcNAc-1-phosphate transferase